MELRNYDLIVNKTTNKEGEEIDIVNIKWNLATNPIFIKEAIANGVEEYEPPIEVEEEEETVD